MPRSILGGQNRLSARLHKAHAQDDFPPVEVESEELSPVEVDVDPAIDLSGFTYRELQTLAKDHDINASGPKEGFMARLLDYFKGV